VYDIRCGRFPAIFRFDKPLRHASCIASPALARFPPLRKSAESATAQENLADRTSSPLSTPPSLFTSFESLSETFERKKVFTPVVHKTEKLCRHSFQLGTPPPESFGRRFVIANRIQSSQGQQVCASKDFRQESPLS
jgi:hypothetical protein